MRENEEKEKKRRKVNLCEEWLQNPCTRQTQVQKHEVNRNNALSNGKPAADEDEQASMQHHIRKDGNLHEKGGGQHGPDD